MSHQLVAEAATRTTHNTRHEKSMPSVGFKLTISEVKLLQTYALGPHGHRDWLSFILFSHVSLHLRTLQLMLPPQVS